MTFLHAGVLAGLAAIAIPILLHLLMRQKPKRLVFPALQLLQDSVRKSTKRLRLRHLWLLLARILILAAVVLAVARPTLPAADWQLSPLGYLLLFAGVAAAVATERVLRRRISETEPAAGLRERRIGRMRAAVVAATLFLLALAVGWPYSRQVAASMREAPTAEELNLPVAAVVLFDVSPSMTYEQGGQTRLERGKEAVAAHVQRLTEGSRVALVENAVPSEDELPNVVFQRSLSALPPLLDRVKSRASVLPLNEAVRRAIAVHEDDIERTGGAEGPLTVVRRLYLVTDLQRSQWRFPDGSGLRAALEAIPNLNVFLLDVGVETPTNRALVELDVGNARLVDGGQATIRARAEVIGEPAGEAAAEVTFVDAEGRASNRGRLPVPDSTDLLFEPRVDVPDADVSEATRYQQGEVVLRGTDPLAFDDVQPFTLAVSKLPRVLIVSPTDRETDRIVAALEGLDETLSPYRIERIRPDELRAQRLREVDIVALVNVPSPSDDQWTALAEFAKDGGGLAVFLGSTDIEPFAYNRGIAQQVLPTALDVYVGRDRFDPDFPLFETGGGTLRARLARLEIDKLLEAAEVRRFWSVAAAEDADVLARLAAEQVPLLVQRRLGRGIVTVLTTAIDYRPGETRWNNLPTLPGLSWVYIGFLDQLMRHLSRSRDETNNYVVGETPRVRLPSDLPETARPKLQTPDLLSVPIEWDRDAASLPLPQARAVGHYQVTVASRVIAAFSVRHADAESDLARVDVRDLETVFGEDRFQLADDLDELSEEIDLAEYGQEGFPFLLLLATALFVAETWLGSRFYDD